MKGVELYGRVRYAVQIEGLPKASTITWILVVRPPRERPMAWSKPPFCARPHYADGL